MSREQLRGADLEVLRAELSGRDLAIIGQVADLRLMSGQQIASVHFPLTEHDTVSAATRACNRVMNRLVGHHALTRLQRQIGGVRQGSTSFVYGLGHVGHRVLGLAGARPRFREPGAAFVLHTLAVAQLVVDCTLAARERKLELLVCQAEPRCWRTFTDLRGVTVLKPDLFLAIGVGDYEHRFFVEVDRGSEHLPTLLRKCHLYQSYYVSGRERAVHGVSPRTCWVVPDEIRADRLRQAIAGDRHLKDTLFVVTTTDQALGALSGGNL